MFVVTWFCRALTRQKTLGWCRLQLTLPMNKTAVQRKKGSSLLIHLEGEILINYLLAFNKVLVFLVHLILKGHCHVYFQKLPYFSNYNSLNAEKRYFQWSSKLLTIADSFKWNTELTIVCYVSCFFYYINCWTENNIIWYIKQN